MTEKPIEKHFAEWESEVFGYGYGTGEPYTLAALKTFVDNIGRPDLDLPNAYDYEILERAMTPPVAWLMINILCHADIIEYGTSPRYGWLTAEGEALREFVATKTVDELWEFCNADDLDHCAKTFCNCGPQGYSEKKLCFNPFWKNRESGK